NGLTQAEVAAAISVTRQTISSYESGRTQPDLETLKSLAEVFNADIGDVLYGRNRRQRMYKHMRRTACILSAVMLGGLLISSCILWITNTFFQVQSGTSVTESTRSLIELRFALLNAKEIVNEVWLAVFNLGCLIQLYFLIALKKTVSLRIKLIWYFSIIAGAFAVVMPFAATDSLYSYADYFIPIIYKALPTVTIVVLISITIDFVAKRKK
ncbi:MAG: helix-turn-helix transcriptional regulator, partial [Spirochaetales bacterium]|nr:helix-turn-helix transcriptional regulator [Spirochaetales bacterium]